MMPESSRFGAAPRPIIYCRSSARRAPARQTGLRPCSRPTEDCDGAGDLRRASGLQGHGFSRGCGIALRFDDRHSRAAPPRDIPRRPAVLRLQAVRYHLDLWPDHGYQLRRVWVGRDLERDEVGGWRIDPGGNGLMLYGASEMPLQFEILAPDRLRLLDTLNQSLSSHELVSDGTFSPADVTLTLGGEMTYMADAASFTECMTGRSYPIAIGRVTSCSWSALMSRPSHRRARDSTSLSTARSSIVRRWKERARAHRRREPVHQRVARRAM